MEETPYFEILTPLRVLIRTTPSYWDNIITQKHPILANQEELAKLTLKEPSEIRSSRVSARKKETKNVKKRKLE
jgi:hypothetical protein